MQILRRWYRGFAMAGVLALSAGMAWSAGDPALETETWSAVVSAMENQPMLPATFQAADEFVRQYPQSPRVATARFLQGEILFRQGADARASDIFQAIPEAAAADFIDSLLFRQGECAFNQGLGEKADACFKQLDLHYPDSPLRPDALALRARLLLEQDKAAEAARICKDPAMLSPGYQTAAAYVLMITRLALSRHRESQLWETLKPLHSPVAGYAKCRLALALHDTSQGSAILEDLWGAESVYKIPAAGIWIKAQMDQGQWAQALDAIERLRNEKNIDPDIRADLFFVQGHCLFNLQRFAEAVTAYRAWLSGAPGLTDPSLPWAYQRLAQAYYHLGKDAQAMAAYKNYLNAFPRGTAPPKNPPVEIFPRRFEQARLAAEKAIWESRCPRVASPWLAMVSEPPILMVQPPPSQATIQNWTWTIYGAHGDVLHQEKGVAAWPEQLAWDGTCLDGQAILAGDAFHYTLIVVDAQGRSLTTTSAPRAARAIAYPAKNAFLLSLQLSVLFENEASDRVSRFGVSLLTQAADLCLRFAHPGLSLELSAPAGGLGERQAAAVLARLQQKLEWPASGITLRLLPSRAPDRERLNLRFERIPEPTGPGGKRHGG